MSIEVALGLIFLALALVLYIVCRMIDMGVFDRIVVRLNNYILSRIDLLEREDI